MSVEFCDTNVLAYAFDRLSGEKHVQAQRVLKRLTTSEDGALSVQVLQELFTMLTRNIATRLPAAEARRIVERLTTWRVFEPASRDVLEAIDFSVRWQVSFWDAMILVAAQRLNAEVVWSEDLNDGQSFGSVTVRNPFRAGG